MATDIFLSHDWGADGKTNHERVSKINDGLKRLGFVTWFDHERMTGNIRQQMANGIENTKCFIAFLTQRYLDKVVSGNTKDNCRLEFDYASNKVEMIAVVLDSCMKNPSTWSGNIGLSLGGNIYVDMSGDINESSYLNKQLDFLKKELAGIGVIPSGLVAQKAAATPAPPTPTPAAVAEPTTSLSGPLENLKIKSCHTKSHINDSGEHF